MWKWYTLPTKWLLQLNAPVFSQWNHAKIVILDIDKHLHPHNRWMYQFGHWRYLPFKTRGYTCTCLASAHDISKTRSCVTNRVQNSVFPTTKLSSHDACIEIALMSGLHKARYYMNWATCTWCWPVTMIPKLLTMPYQMKWIEQANYIGNRDNNCIYGIGT